MKSLKVKTEGGYLIATTAPDPEFPGIDVEFVADDANVEGTRPRVLFEKQGKDPVRALIWANKNDEDYTHEVVFSGQR